LAIGLFAVWLMIYFIARELLELGGMPTWMRVVIALVPVAIYGGLLIQVVRGLKHLDELELRIQLEALTIAFPLTLLMLFTLGLMERAVGLKFEDWSYSHVAMYPICLYVICIGIAAKRYQ
jgi:hypothetical protein